MKIQITGRHLRITKAIHTYVDEKVSKAQKYFNHIVWAQVLLSVEKHTHEAEVIIHASRQTFRALGTSESLYAAIDLASDKIDKQLRKYKERLKSRYKEGEPELEPAAWDVEPKPVRFTVIKQVNIAPMTADAAAEEMDRLGLNFWMFQDQDSRQINVIFRRLDDSYGLLQPARKGSR
ncbi:MAG: ribosome-associated translation inhibitor RaiA [Elusimicrobiota bacterium]